MPALRSCRHCRTAFPAEEDVFYCSAECESAHEQQCRANVEAGREKRRATNRARQLERKGLKVASPPAVVGDWRDLPLIQRAEFIQAHGPQLGEEK